MNSSVCACATMILILWLALSRSTQVFGRPKDKPKTPKTGKPLPNPKGPSQSIDVTRFGAVGNGKTDDTKAFLSAWDAACKQQAGNAMIIVPGGKTFLVSVVEFAGPCRASSIVYQILGSIVAPPRSAWKNPKLATWINFTSVGGLTVDGNNKKGVIDGAGDSWWKFRKESDRPTALRFSKCGGLKLRGMKHLNSQQNHISIHACDGAVISDLEIRAPKESPNTDGIDVSHSKNVQIHNSVIATGDDCIALNQDTSDVMISNIACGPGHGISIGSLGKGGGHGEVQRINVTSCSFTDTQNGVRIKTYQGGSGFVRNVVYSNLTFTQSGNPVIIDQYYCPHAQCAIKAGAVQVSNVNFYGLHGTANTEKPTINLSCSKTVPCQNITLNDINIRSVRGKTYATCINAHGRANTMNPVVSCLMK